MHAALFTPRGRGYHDSMRIACSSCNAAYDVPPERVPPGKGVKCARCGTIWVPVERVDARPVFEPVAEIAPAAIAEPLPIVLEPAGGTAQPAARRSAVPAMLAWLLTIILLAALGWAAVTYRAGVIQAWPNAARAYALVGLR